MSYCINPGCAKPENPNTDNYCRNCGAKLLLKQRYRPLQPIGQGGFGRTFLAVDEDIPSQPACVVKQLYFQAQAPDQRDKAIALFQQEAVRLHELGKHPQIPDLLAHFEQDQQLYLVQEFIEGETLAQVLERQGIFPEEQIWQLLHSLLPVLKFIHQRQIIHRDIKPANIIQRVAKTLVETPTPQPSNPLAGESVEAPTLVLIDFGIAKLITGTALIQTGTIIGSPEFMAPEQTRGKAVPASDLYSLGVTCIHLLTGVPPFDLFDSSNDCWVWRDCLPAGIRVSARLGQILDKLLQNAVSQRYQLADEVLQALVAPLPAPPELTPPPALSSALRQHPLVKFLSQWATQPQPDSYQGSLNSAAGVDYTKLQNFLVTGRWKEADQETWAVLCQAIGKPLRSYLSDQDIQQLPCEDLQTIDQLWLQYSHGRFGLSVQAKIYISTGEDYGRFCDRIGWPQHNTTQSNSWQFTQTAPVGHLPSRIWVGGYHWWRHATAMKARLTQCKML